MFLKRDFKKANNCCQEKPGFTKVIKEDDNQLLKVGNENILINIAEDDNDSTVVYSFTGYGFLSKILFAKNTKNTLTLESTPMVF